MSFPVSKKKRWAGRIITAVPVLFMLWDSVIKLMDIPPVVDSFVKLGYPAGVAISIGLLELSCLLVYLIPQTSILGAVLLTGYLGGAIATHVRVGDPLLTHVLFPGYVAALIWGGLWSRDYRLRSVLGRDPVDLAAAR